MESRVERMERGPYLAADDVTLCIPSEWWKEETRAFWRSLGCRWTGTPRREWTRDVRKPYKGKLYSTRAWLLSVRKAFYEFYPDLKGDRDDETQ